VQCCGGDTTVRSVKKEFQLSRTHGGVTVRRWQAAVGLPVRVVHRVVAGLPDNIVTLNEFRASVGAQWTFLSDAGRKIAKDLDIAEYTDPCHDPMIPHTAGRRAKWPP
jgi:hypothetical protein